MSDMSVASAVSSTQQSNSIQQSQWAQVQSLFKQLGQALENGDLAAAKTAFAALQNLAPQGAAAQTQGAASAQRGQAASTQGPMAALATALQNGDLAGAQQAFSQLQQAQGHHHHHHHGSQASSSTASSAATSNTSSPITISGSNDTVNIYETGGSGTGSINVTA
jgi:ribosomal protein S20